MRSCIKCLVLLPACLAAADLPYFSILSSDAGSWPAILSSAGLLQQPASRSRVFVARAGASASPEWRSRVQNGAILILEGESSLAEMFGFVPGSERVRAGSLVDVHNPGMRVIWENALEIPRFGLPAGATVFARERWSGAPLSAGVRHGSGAVLWIAMVPGDRGYERFPYLIQALGDLGLEPPFRSSRLWAFFDYSYRTRVDPDYLAAWWSRAGIAALHVAAWHFFDPDPERDEYLRRLVESCHRAGILVYAWLELPHVSGRFWQEHPEWREKTALLQDAHLDWRQLMNLANRDCFRAAAEGVRKLCRRFDWDGLNLAELYFESLEGIDRPARFTPMNDDVRGEFRRLRGFDPIELFRNRNDAASRRLFLEFRSDLARRMQQEWLDELDRIRVACPHLDLVLTHVDDRLDPGVRDATGADASRVLPLLDRKSFTFLIEDPATVWHLGAGRYEQLSEMYRALTPHHERLAIDLNIVERYQDVYPTRQQTGVELFQMVHRAASVFPRVALYFERSLQRADIPWLASAAAAVSRIDAIGGKLAVESSTGFGLAWKGGALVDGEPWPIAGADTLWLPAGAHAVERSGFVPPFRVERFSGTIRAGAIDPEGRIELSYQSSSRALALTSVAVERVEIDGSPQEVVRAGSNAVFLPRGQHLAVLTPVP